MGFLQQCTSKTGHALPLTSLNNQLWLQVLADAFSAQRGSADLGDEGSTELAQKRLRIEGGGVVAGPAAAQAELMRLEEPWRRVSTLPR